jgi:hypothetical protein
MKKILPLLLIMILAAACNTAVCPAYGDSANNVRSSLIQSGSYRANGINRIYRDSYSYKKNKAGK